MSLSSTAVQIFTERIIEAHIGQGLDLYWAHHTKVPTEEEYFTMVDGSRCKVRICSVLRNTLTP